MTRICLFALLLLAGCRSPRWDTPESAYASFAQALQRGELKVAYEGLSGPTREALALRAKQISSASGGAVREEPMLLALLTGEKAEPVTAVRVVRQEGGSAVIEATAGGKSAEVRMVKEGERWTVDLTEGLK